MFASLDRVVAGKKIVELKNARTAEGWGRAYTDEVPEHYLIQVQHQLHVGIKHGLEEKADVAVLIGGSEFRVYHVSYLPHFGAALEDHLKRFWEKVRDKVAPQVTEFDRPELVNLLYHPHDGVKIELGEDARELLDEYQRLGMELTMLKAHRDLAQARLITLMGHATEGHFADGRLIRRRLVTRREYHVPESTFFDFRICKEKDPCR
jgi:predicted phage-related endonuclease